MPMLEKAGEKKWGKDPEYQHYMKATLKLPKFGCHQFGGPEIPEVKASQL